MLKIVKFYTTWCVPCKQLTPILDELKNEFNNKFKVEEVCLDNGIDEKYQNLNLMSTPTIVIFKGDVLLEQISGLKSKSFYKEKLSEYLK